MAMSKRDQQIMMFGLPVLIAGALFWFGYYDEASWWNTYQANIKVIAENETKLVAAMKEENNLVTLQTEVEGMREELLIAEKLLPKENDYQGLLKRTQELVEEAGISKNEILGFQPTGQSSHESYKEWPISIRFKQLTWSQLIELLNRFDNFERLLDVTSLPFSITDPVNNKMAIDLVVNVYIFKEAQPEVAAQ